MQLQGTPTGLFNNVLTEIPSFLIGNYDFNQPPAGIDTATVPPSIAFFPNHFADDLSPLGPGYLSWSAPFTYLAATGQTPNGQTTILTPSLGHSSIVADDSQTTATTYQVYVAGTPPTPASGVDAGWTVQWASSSAAAWTPQIQDVTAAGDPTAATPNLEYVRQPAVSVPVGSKVPTGTPTATWTFTAPAAFSAPAAAGLYSVVFHLPDPQAPKLADGTTANPNYPEHRIGDAHYVVTLTHAGVTTKVFDTDKLNTDGTIARRAAISQTETNDPQPLAGPFALSAGDVLKVILDNTTTLPITTPASTYVLADAVSLVPTASAGGSARMDGSPTAINATDFPEIADALYYGFAVTRDPTTGVPTQADDNTNPFGNKTIGTPDTSTGGIQHNIRQLVYFGRTEGIVLTDTAGNLVDTKGAPVTTPVTRMVGAIYCVNGITGGVVWRFQTSDVLNPNGTIARPSAPVYTTPAIARINVLVNGVVETKLCVVAADDNGLVYCLDAIGNRNGTDNSTAIEPTYNQPIYSPGAALNIAGAPDVTPHAHIGNTTAYWVYRPDAARPRLLGSTATKKIDPTSDLPVPAAFGLASPTIYVNPNTAINTATLAPGAPAPAPGLPPNGLVYIGNSNGTLYKLDATGATVTETTPTTTTAPGSGIFYSATEPYNYVLPISLGGLNPAPAASFTPLPTPTVGWWFAVNKGATNDTSQTANVAITSAPSIYQPNFTSAATGPPPSVPPHLIYFATSNETTNVGNVFSVLDTGPVNPSATPTGLTVGGVNYNILARPNWSFPNAYANTGDKIVHAALGSISGSPVVFTNPDDPAASLTRTRVYFAANQGPEGYQAERPAPAESGRVWAVDALTGNTQWAYPDTVDPNKDNTAAGSTSTIGGTTVTQTQIDALPTLGTFRNASPAIGVVQFPATIGYGTAGTTGYVHTDAINTTNVTSASVPMLYVGSRTEAPDSSNFFSLDLDGINDDQRNIHFINGVNNTTTNIAPVGNTYGSGFESSPLLVTNPGPSTGTVSGNGGVVFIAASNNTLNELSATPTTDIGADSTGPQFTNFAQISGFGAFASPAIAGFANTGLTSTNATLIPTAFVDTDWVYGGDSTLGIARGITPGDRNGSGSGGGTGGTVDFGTGGTGPDTVPPSTNPQQFPLHTYLFDNTGTHDPKSTNMGLANPIATSANPNPGPIGAFEWGDKLYIRISNVVPPNPPTSTNVAGDPTLYMADPNDKSVYYTNGGTIQVQLSDIDANGKIVAGRGADIATVNTNLLAGLTDPNGNGFIKENPSGSGALDNVGDMLTDNLGTGSMWLGAATYAIGDGSNRKNTPGSRRQIISATQVVEAHDATPGANFGKFLQTVTLSVNVNSSPNSFRRGKKIIRIPKVDQPTFAVLNPLAVRGGGPNIPLGSPSSVSQINDVAGPFYGIDTTNPVGDDLVAYVNGNNGYVAAGDVPKSGVLLGDKGTKHFRQVTTATTDIPHGSIGSNGNPADPAAQRSPTFQSDRTATQLNGGTLFGNYAFDVADRSDLGLNGSQISNLTIQTSPIEWNDNTNSYAGPGAVVNPLPWDDAPTAFRAGNNSSVDYPNIGKQRLGQTLYNNNSTSGASVSDNGAALDPTPSPAGTTPANRQVQPDNVKIEVSVPKYQSANLQLYNQTAAATATSPATGQRIPPSGLTTSTQTVYPMGYVSRETVYVDSNHNHRRDDGEAFRTFRVFTGVPVDMSMSVADPTIDLGKLPQTFGVQTDAASTLGPFMPFQSTAALSAAGAGYQKYFKPIVAHNDGNINLLNIHFDQKLRKYTAAGGGATIDSALPFGSDALDAQATLNAFDLNGVTGLTTNTEPRKYILRTSLDTDLAQYNRNPYLAAQNGAAYPGATFHKARVSDANPPTLTVPDKPHDNVGPYSLPASTTIYPTTAFPVVDATTHLPTNYGMPYIGLAVPLGTPVGNYAQDVRLFEGIDPYAYPDIQSAAGTNHLYKPLFPPIYGGAVVDGTATPAATDDTLTTIGSSVTQPYSNPTRIRASIVETRVTDGATYGNLPQVDALPAPFNVPTAANPNPRNPGAADFLPVAFRSAFWSGGSVTGNSALNLYWTSASPRPAVANAPPYTLIGAHAPFSVSTTTPKYGYFQADTTNSSWYDQIAGVAVPAAGFNTAISIAPDQHLLSGSSFSSDGTAYAFVQNVIARNSTTAYQNNLYCYSVNTTTGGITGAAVPISTDTRQPKFGARGLKFSVATVGFKDALTPNAPINDNLWAFWNGGTRGRSTLFYSSTQSANVDGYTAGGATPFTATAQALPTPAGLSGVSDPTAVLTSTTLPNGSTVPAIDVTYSGVNADGNTDVYVSRYLPYNVRAANGTAVLTDASGKNVVALALTPSPAITEQLLPDTAHQFYQARDVAWARADTLNVQVNNVSVLQDKSKTQNADGSYPLFVGIQASYDRATGTAVYTIPNSPVNSNSFTVGSGTLRVTTVYADLVRGRVRFRTAYTASGGTNPSRFDVPVPDGDLVSATFQPQARRITTDRRADTEPVSFIDDAYKPNEAPGLNRVQTARYWFIWRKSAAPGTTTTPTLYTKTQRLTLYLNDGNNHPVPLPLTNAGVPVSLILTDTAATNPISAANLAANVDVDWARGRLYFPQTIGGIAVEGHRIHAVFTYTDSQGRPNSGGDVTDNVHWLDELRYNDPAAQPTGDPATTVDTNEHAVSIDVAVNEGSPSAFLDPFAYADVVGGAYDPYGSDTATTHADQPHKVWLFWNSTRNGTADVYYETIAPRFSANP